MVFSARKNRKISNKLDQENYSFDESSQESAGKDVSENENKSQAPIVGKQFRRSIVSYLILFILLILYPYISVMLTGDPAQALRMMSVSRIVLVYAPTILLQWLLFLLVWLAAYREGTGLVGVGFKRIRLIDFVWAVAFLFASNLILSLLSALLAAVNLKIPAELGLILPETTNEKIVWTILCLTAGVFEETAFRGYLITRIRIFGRMKNWILPVTVASLAFGSGHIYQGLGGFILITIYGVMFSILFLKTKSLWPCVIAHFLQDMITGLFFGT